MRVWVSETEFTEFNESGCSLLAKEESANYMQVGELVLQISLPSLYPECKVTAAPSPHSMQMLKWVYCWRSQALDWDLVGHKV